MNFDAACAQLEVSANVCETNAPINDEKGDKAQAALERTNADNYREAIRRLQS